MLHRQALPVTITLPPQLLSIADRIAKREGRTRSELFREALRAFFWKKRWEAIQVYGADIAKRKGIKEEDIEDIVDSFRK